MEKRPSAAGDNVATIRSGIQLLCELSPDTYQATTEYFAGGGVGRHFRHILDHYLCFQAGFGSDDRRIDYDGRKRNPHVETDPKYAIEQFQQVADWLQGLPDEIDSQELLVKMDTGESDPIWAHSSVSRELQFLLSHTVHHYALIKPMLRVQGVEAGADFGVAPSTLKHERRTTQYA